MLKLKRISKIMMSLLGGCNYLLIKDLVAIKTGIFMIIFEIIIELLVIINEIE